ncbi:MAG: phage/plasmid primase, P4 family [Elusimicrobia bacterium]|nr:phage/plasmid primase, P4 family [Elusimicrobiota bacterium]
MSELSPGHASALAASAISEAALSARGYYTASTGAELKALGFGPAQQLAPALVIPIHDVSGAVAMHVARPDAPRAIGVKRDGTPRIAKYEFPARSRMVLDVPPASRQGLADPSGHLWVTEGSKKADAAVSAGLCCVSIIGVWNWRGKNDLGGLTALGDWEAVTLKDRNVYVVFDSDVMVKKEVHKALVRFKGFLGSRGAKVWIVYLPDGQGGAKQGLDDFLASGGTVAELYEFATREIRPPRLPHECPEAGEIHETDVGNSLRLVARHGKDMRHSSAVGGWLVWDRSRWAPDGTGEAKRRAVEAVMNMYNEAKATSDHDAKMRLYKHAVKSESNGRVTAMLDLASVHRDVAVSHEDLDTDPYLLTCANGTIDLRSGALRKHDPADLITKWTPIDYDPEAKCALWEWFLTSVMGEDPDMVAFLQRAIGYSLTGDTREDAIFFLHGLGDNGKSTFVEIIQNLTGDYGKGAKFDTFLDRQKGGPTEDLARLRGARLVTAPEAPEGKRFDESLQKELSGGDAITCRELYCPSFTYPPQFKLWFSGNHKPQIRGQDNGIWRRMFLVPFGVAYHDPTPENAHLPEALKKDPGLPGDLRGELPGILAWAVRGCLEWQKTGLGAPGIVRAATKEYRTEMDTIGAFLDDRCVVSPNARVTCAALYSAFAAWCKESGEYQITSNAFSRKLIERGGVEKCRDTRGAKAFRGVALIATNNTPDSWQTNA